MKMAEAASGKREVEAKSGQGRFSLVSLALIAIILVMFFVSYFTKAEVSGLQIHPMKQFVVKPLFGGKEFAFYTPTIVTLWMGLAVLSVVGLLVLGTRGRAIVPSRVQSVAELLYGFVYKMVEDVSGKDGVKYFPHVMTLFVFILAANFLGLIPYSYTTTAQLAVTATMALLVFFGVTLLGLYKHGLGFLKIFWVSQAPLALRPVLAIIEVISYFVRPVSHSIRLMGNMMAGHAVIKVFAGFAGVMGLGAVAPILAITAVYALETLVAFIQAYVFAILTCVYLRDALHPGH
jgi:F-type H+-transporting ATPase subunit a